MSGGGSCGLYCFCCGIFRKQTEYVTDREIQNTNSEGDTVGTGINMIFLMRVFIYRNFFVNTE